MKTVFLQPGFRRIEYDLILWSDNSRAKPANCLLGIPLGENELKQLSERIWNNYLLAIEDTPDYFIRWNEPFPESEETISTSPLDLENYMKNSMLWNDFIVQELGGLLNWDYKEARYLLLSLESVSFQQEQFFLVFRAIDKDKN